MPAKRPPTSDAQKALLKKRQLEYIANDPRWALHRSRIANAQRDPKQRETLSASVKRYRQLDPRWPDHQARLNAAAEVTNRITLLPEEVEAVLSLRKKGRTFEYIAEEICVGEKVIRRELRAMGISTARIKPDKRANPGKGLWRCFEAA